MIVQNAVVGNPLPLPDPCFGLPGLPRQPLPAEPFRHLAEFTAKEAEVFLARQAPEQIPPDPRPRLEAARLDLLALFRALDQMDRTPAEIPQRLIRQLFELDAN